LAPLSEAALLIYNGSRSTGRGNPWKGRTHCEYGHEYTAENTMPASTAAGAAVASANANECAVGTASVAQRYAPAAETRTGGCAGRVNLPRPLGRPGSA
jgi:hypothetical protein